jgi:rare lipoprotein A
MKPGMRPLVFLFLLLVAALPRVAAQAAPAAGAGAPPPASGTVFTGVASWYGEGFHGKTTANGETYDKEAMTAAHKTLPFGTLLLVRSLDSQASVVVRVNDRGPFVAGRDLDLSEAAARLLGMLVTGTARVTFTVLAPEEAASFGLPGAALGAAAAKAERHCRIQVASFKDDRNAGATLERLRLSGLAAVIETSGPYRRVVFPAVEEKDAEALAARLRTLGYIDLLVTWY